MGQIWERCGGDMGEIFMTLGVLKVRFFTELAASMLRIRVST